MKTQKQLSQLNEALISYVSKLSSSPEKTSYKNINSMHSFLNDRVLLVKSIQKGIPFSLFNFIVSITPFSDSDWADYLNISLKSLQRFRNEKEHIFKPIHSEKILEVAEVSDVGLSVFDTYDQFYLWLTTPSFALGNMKPIDLIKNSYGKEMVINELHNIDQGVFA